MAEPKTLLEMAGADTAPNGLQDSALVLIDCQMEYVSGGLPLSGVKPALDEAGRVLQRARDAGAPVIHIIHRGEAGGAFDLEGPGGAIAPEVAPLEGEPVIVKEKPNAFADTALHEMLQQKGVSNLIVAGFMTHMCLSSTARAAFDLGYRTTVVGGAAATRDLPKPGGGAIDAHTLHDAALAALADYFVSVVGKADDLPA